MRISDWSSDVCSSDLIARTLGISEETATLHLKTARERYGVSKRLPLAIRALYDGQISFWEAIGCGISTPFWELSGTDKSALPFRPAACGFAYGSFCCEYRGPANMEWEGEDMGPNAIGSTSGRGKVC